MTILTIDELLDLIAINDRITSLQSVHSNSLCCGPTGLHSLEENKKASQKGSFFVCDPDRIQTCNRWSRNPVRYSVAPRGHLNLTIGQT